MQDRLELKHLARYLPYGLKVFNGKGNLTEILKVNIELNGQCSVNVLCYPVLKQDLDCIEPVLRPLSDLTKEIEHNGERFVPSERLNPEDFDFNRLMIEQVSKSNVSKFLFRDVNKLPYDMIKQLHEWHFDTFGLIEAGLAIDKNTL